MFHFNNLNWSDELVIPYHKTILFEHQFYNSIQNTYRKTNKIFLNFNKFNAKKSLEILS